MQISPSRVHLPAQSLGGKEQREKSLAPAPAVEKWAEETFAISMLIICRRAVLRSGVVGLGRERARNWKLHWEN